MKDDKEGQIDLLINNAGFGISGAAKYTKLENTKKQFDVNFFGVVNMTKAVLPYMRAQEQGRIINLSCKLNKKASEILKI